MKERTSFLFVSFCSALHRLNQKFHQILTSVAKLQRIRQKCASCYWISLNVRNAFCVKLLNFSLLSFFRYAEHMRAAHPESADHHKLWTQKILRKVISLYSLSPFWDCDLKHTSVFQRSNISKSYFTWLLCSFFSAPLQSQHFIPVCWYELLFRYPWDIPIFLEPCYPVGRIAVS